MAVLDWSQCPAIESVPGKVSGARVFRGTRLPISTAIENLEDLSVDEVIEQFDVTREQIEAVLDFVAESGDQFRCTRPSRSANRGSVRIGSNSGAVFNV
jgi:uncharacterized protein (DUF433 family)